MMGLELMARGGFNPEASIQLWRNMGVQQTESSPPEFLSTHPAHATRIDGLAANMSDALTTYQQAQQQGRRPDCRK
jgi:predicted Zn-dependent protease